MKEITVVDSTRKVCIVGDRIQVADSFLDKLVGLMGRKSLVPGTGMLLRPCSTIHTCWMRTPIDVLYLDKHWRVVAIDAAVKPWRVGSIRFRTRMVLELPAGTAEQFGIELGDQLAIEDAGTKPDKNAGSEAA
jgi:hypothetical protein